MPRQDVCATSRLVRAVAAVCIAAVLRTPKASRGLCQVAMVYEYGVGAHQVMQIIIKLHHSGSDTAYVGTPSHLVGPSVVHV